MSKNAQKPNPFSSSTAGLIRQRENQNPPAVTNMEHTPSMPPAAPARYVETRNKRLQLTQFPSLVDALARYAKENNTSSNQVVEKLLIEFLVEQGYYHK